MTGSPTLPLYLHTNESPYGPPDGVREAVAEEIMANCHRYPDSECRDLRAAIADHHDVPDHMVAVGNGLDELILLAVHAYAGYGGNVVLTDRTFPGYASSSESVGGKIRKVPLEDYRVAAPAMVEAISVGTDLAFVCNPHNPTGTLLAPGQIRELIDVAEATGAVLVVDEAYMDFAYMDSVEARSTIDEVRAGRQVIVLRTFSKAWSMAALRVGYAVGPTRLIDKLWQARRPLPFSVNPMAQRAVPIAVRHEQFVESVRRQTAQVRELMFTRLHEARVRYLPSVTNFVMVSTGSRDSAAVAARLADDHQIYVRDLAGFELPGWIRVTIGTRDQIEYTCAALGAVLT
ncbi:pyridoxal phosphate-dependent aminotransferase [Nocardia vaccinii]|uniref:pyridoxal phosphate-dependent aminotransferase n=1 Tax=Nocardia vaccinii TaxID=1822 RepID=UPI00082B0CF0|nr:histidinol-phosphate transaminase [Nocardia vaccinii]